MKLAAEIELFAANVNSLLLCVSCSKFRVRSQSCSVYGLQRISIRCRIYVVFSESAFFAEFVLCAANQGSLSKLCGLQRISFLCRICVVCRELVFAAKIVLTSANQSSLLKLCSVQ